MRSVIHYIIILILIILTLHLIGIFANLYEQGIQIDIPQHILGGIILGIIWLKVINLQFHFSLQKTVIFISISSFVIFVGFLWEILEFIVWQLFPNFANSFKFYSPTVQDLLSDMISNLIGGLVVAFYAIQKNPKFLF